MFEKELEDSCAYNDTRIERTFYNEIKDFFMEELEKYVDYFVHEFQLQGVEIIPCDLGDMESGDLFTASFESTNETLHIYYDMEICDDSGDVSILIIRCDAFKCKLSEYQNGEVDYDEETGLYEPIAEDEKYSYFEKAKTMLENYIKEEMIL